MAELQYLAPVIQVSDIGKAIEFFALLGFAPRFQWGEPVEYAVLGREEAFTIHLNRVDSPALRATGLFLQVDDADAFWTEIRDKVEVLSPITDEPYGMRDFTVFGPSEISVTIGHVLSPSS